MADKRLNIAGKRIKERRAASGMSQPEVIHQMLLRVGRTIKKEQLSRIENEHHIPDVLRRTCALWCHRGGMSLESIRRLLGHSDFATLRRYLDLDDSDVHDQFDVAPPSSRLR